jgi:adenosine deaminase
LTCYFSSSTNRSQLEEIAYRFCTYLQRSGTRYADLIFNPDHWPAWTGRLEAFVDALDHGFAAAESDGLPPVGLCISLSRSQSRSEALALVDHVLGLAHDRIIGLSIDGNESAVGRTSEHFAPAFDRAGSGGLHLCAHAGESSGPEGVWDAISLLCVERVDHGIRAIEDPALVKQLAARRIPLDVCPTSNIRLGLAPSLKDHPIERLRRSGVRVSVNSDDPVLFETSQLDELHKCATVYGWDRTAAIEIARTSISASFAPESLVASLLDDLNGGASPHRDYS